MTPRFQFQVGDIVTAKNLPIELIDKGFVNGIRFRIRFGWINNATQAYYVQGEKTVQQVLQSADGIVNGYASYFIVDNVKKD